MEANFETPGLPVSYRQRTPLENFGEMLRFLRKKKSLDEHQFAQRSGLSLSTIRSIEAGTAPFEEVIQSLPGLSAGMGVRPDLLSEALFSLGMVE